MFNAPINVYTTTKLTAAATIPIAMTHRFDQIPHAENTAVPPPRNEIIQSINPAENPNPLDACAATTRIAHTADNPA